MTARVADHLGWCRAQPAGRLNRLVTLSKTAPDDVLPRLFAAVDRILSSSSGTHALDGEDSSALRRKLAGLLARGLAEAGGILDADLDYDTAAAAEALSRAAPAETAQLLTDRTLSTALPVIPFAWKELLLQQHPEQREPLADAYHQRIEPYLVPGSLPPQAETAALDVLDILGRDSPRWAALVRGWAAGNTADRSRAAVAVRHRWKDPIWQELVPGLLDKGLSEHSATILRQGIILVNDVAGATGINDRLDALQPLLNDPRAVVRQFAGEAVKSLYPYLSLLRDRKA